jgi:hypothetical protein
VTPAAISSSFYFCQLGAAVDAADFLRVVHEQRFHRELAAPVDADEVRQIELPLRVLRRDTSKRVEQRREVEGVDAGVDLANLPLRRRRVALFHDAGNVAVHADDATVAIRALDRGRDDGCGRRGRRVCLEQLPQRRGREERYVAREQNDGAGLARQDGLSLLQRVRRAELRLLHGERQAWAARQALPDGGASVAHNHGDRGGSHSRGRVEHVLHHRAPRHRMEHLWKL